MFRTLKIVAVSSMLISGVAHADADDWYGYPEYGQSYGYAPVVQEEFVVTPRGVVEEEIVYVPERVVEYEPAPPRYYAPMQNYYSYVQPGPTYGGRDWDD